MKSCIVQVELMVMQTLSRIATNEFVAEGGRSLVD